ncbi:hypothetical protein EDB83DRAFT_2517283 [Lactarius deliciosus]|nr:hypothetical protein EDB83DRAFT_2517283 [Lactarius deliciosus]
MSLAGQHGSTNQKPFSILADVMLGELPNRLTSIWHHLALDLAWYSLAFMQAEAKSRTITLEVAVVWYDCPTDDLSPAFRGLRNEETDHVLRVIADDVTVLSAPRPFTVAAYQAAALASRAFGGHDVFGAELREPVAPTAVPVATIKLTIFSCLSFKFSTLHAVGEKVQPEARPKY